MRFLSRRSVIAVLCGFLLVFLYITFRSNYLPMTPVPGGRQIPSPTPTVKTLEFVDNITDDVLRITKLVDSLPVRAPPAVLKHGFKYLGPKRPNTPITTKMPLPEAEPAYYKYIQTLQMMCPTKVRIGQNVDGGWDACVSGPFNISSPCLVYSIGLGAEWSFDHMITDKYKCLDMAYDPTIGKKTHKPKKLLWFYNIGLGRVNMVTPQKWSIKTFQTLLEENGHLNTTIDILKIDIEYWEWGSLESMLRWNSLRNVKQLMVEFHTKEVHGGQSSSVRDYAYYWQILRGLDRIGFKTWHYLATPTGHYKSKQSGTDLPCCANVYFVNTAYLV